MLPVEPGPRLAPQFELSGKPPVSRMLLIDRGPLPPLNRTTLWGTVGFPTLFPPKFRKPLLSKARADVPVPRKAIDWLPPGPSSTSVRVAPRRPKLWGVNVRGIEQ